VQPEAVATSLIAAHHLHCFGETETLLGPLDLPLKSRQVGSIDGTLPRPLPQSDGEAQLPLLVA